MALVPELNDTTYPEASAAEGIVVVDFAAGWCKPCQRFKPIFEEAAERHDDHQFATVDREAQKDLAERQGITTVPTLQVYRDGILLLQRPGSLSAEGIDDLIAQAEALDMKEVRAAAGS